MQILIIRHGRTQGNIERRYVGCRTDEPLIGSEREELKAIDAEAAKSVLIVSPMLRARQTAEILLPGVEPTVVEELRETDFGMFEGKTYEELISGADTQGDYQAWIESGGTMKIPGGEGMEESQARSLAGFRKAVDLALAEDAESLIIIAHGGTVMSVMSSLFGGNYYDYYTGNGEGYKFEVEVDDAGDITAAGPYDSFCGRVRA